MCLLLFVAPDSYPHRFTPLKGVTQSCIFRNTGLSQGQCPASVFDYLIFLGLRLLSPLLAGAFRGTGRRNKRGEAGGTALPWTRVSCARVRRFSRGPGPLPRAPAAGACPVVDETCRAGCPILPGWRRGPGRALEGMRCL